MESKTIMVGTIRTHYFEMGSGEPLILLHSGEFGANSEISWAYNMEALAQHFHVYAVDMVGYGYTQKCYDFENMAALRINHIKEFMRVLMIEEAHFMGNSMGGGLILNVASQREPAWKIKSIISISGGGPINTETFEVLNNYDGTKEHMKKIVDLLFWEDRWKTDEFIDKRVQASLIPGHWESLRAALVRSPVAEQKKLHLPEYENINVPVLICGGEHDTIKLPDYAEKLKMSIPHARVEIFKQCSHCAHIEYHDKFNELAIGFLLNQQ